MHNSSTHSLPLALLTLVWGCASTQQGSAEAPLTTDAPSIADTEVPSDADTERTEETLDTLAVLPIVMVDVHIAQHRAEVCALCAVYEQVRESTFVVLTDSGLGSAVLVGARGLALTNAHVVGDSMNVTVGRYDGETFSARVVAFDLHEDFALLRIAELAPTTPVASLRATPPRVGSEVYAVGHPLGLGWTISRGIVSGLPVIGGRAMVQTDTPISPGNSGGPLVDAQGYVVGIVTEKLSGGGAENIAFARPAAAALQFLRDAGISIGE